VRALADEVAVLRGELKTLRDAKRLLRNRSHVLLTSLGSERDVAPSATSPPLLHRAGAKSAPPVPQVAQTQTYGALPPTPKLSNPDISLIGDFIGPAGRNTISPSRRSNPRIEVGMQSHYRSLCARRCLYLLRRRRCER